MSQLLYRLSLFSLWLCLAQTVAAQVDLSVRVEVATPLAEVNVAIPAMVYIANEGETARSGSAVEIRTTRALELVGVGAAGEADDPERFRWVVPRLEPGHVDSLPIVVEARLGGIHVLTAELVEADGDDWDSTPDNAEPAEDDQQDACITVPIELLCGQGAVLRAPAGYEAYTWYRNDTVLAYASADTLHPQASGHYRYTLDGAACSSGNCCPVVVQRQPCGNDLALVATVAPSPRGSAFYTLAVEIHNEGGSAISETDIYLTTSPYFRLANQGSTVDWRISADRMAYTYAERLEPGQTARIAVEVQTISGGEASDYEVFAEISGFRSGGDTLADMDSTPDDDPDNDLIVDDGRGLSPSVDEDDSDIAVLSDCAALTIAGPRDVCFGETFELVAAVRDDAGASFSWSGDADFSCRSCATPEITVSRATTLRLSVVDSEGCRQTQSVEITGRDCGGCALTVLAQAGYDVVAVGAAAPEICIAGPEDVSASLAYALDGRPLDAPQGSCAKGRSLILPADLTSGTYELTARGARGCEQSVDVRVARGAGPLVERDTFRRQVEVGEPLFLAGLEGFAPEAGGSWERAADGYWAAFAQTGTAVASFSNADLGQRREGRVSVRTYLVEVIDYVCAPLVADASLVVETSTCSGQQVGLGLTRPDLSALSTLGRVRAVNTATGQRPGARYDLAAGVLGGLTQSYRISSWSGLPAAVGLEGNIQEIVAELRRGGHDVYVDWDESALYAGGEDLGPIVVEVRDGRTVLNATTNTLPTYGRMYARPGIALVTVSDGTCVSEVSVELACKQPPIIWGNNWTVTLDLPTFVPFAMNTLPSGFSLTGATQVPEGLSAKVAADGSGITVTASRRPDDAIAIGLEARNAEGESIHINHNITVAAPAVVTACDADTWHERSATRYVPLDEATADFVLPLDFDPERDRVTVNGELVPGSELTVSRSQRPVVQTYAAHATVTALRSPFGKTVNVVGGDVAEAIAGAFADAEAEASATQVQVTGAELVGGLYARAENGSWERFEPLAIASANTYAVALPVGAHALAIARERDGGTCRDTIAVDVAAATVVSSRDAVLLRVGEPGQYCLPAPRVGAVVTAVVNECERNSGERVVVEWDGDCLRLEAYEAGEEEVCLRREYLDGGKDVLHLRIEAEALPELDVIADRDTLEFGAFKVLEVLANDQLADEALSLSLVSEPYFGRAQVVGNAAIEYLHSGGDCAPDVFTYEVCQGDVCDSTTVEIAVFCEDLLVYNGLSPNGDGVNEEFTILGLGQYPNHEVSIFDREGRMVTAMRDYANDWRGTVSGAPLPAGTYFYVIDLGNGEARSGYLQLTR